MLGANDGVVSTACLIAGVAGAGASYAGVRTAGIAGLFAGALSMALGEYVSVSSQRDTERALIAKERWELETMPSQELAELTSLYRAKGLSAETAERVAVELTAHDALAAHLETELRISQDDVVNPWHAAGASALSFLIGAVLPMLAILLPPLGVFLQVGFGAQFWINILLTLLGYFPGIIHAVYIIAKR